MKTRNAWQNPARSPSDLALPSPSERRETDPSTDRRLLYTF